MFFWVGSSYVSRTVREIIDPISDPIQERITVGVTKVDGLLTKTLELVVTEGENIETGPWTHHIRGFVLYRLGTRRPGRQWDTSPPDGRPCL